MGAGSVKAPAAPPKSWTLRPDAAAQTQALVVTGFGKLPTGRALFLEFKWPVDGAAPRWLDALAAVAPITSAEPPDKSDPDAQTQAAALAFSYTGLRRMGLADTALASFDRPFREGMFQEDRLRRLGDRRPDAKQQLAWLPTVIANGPVWSANVPKPPQDFGAAGAFDVPKTGSEEARVTTPVTVHALLLLYARDDAAANVWVGQVKDVLGANAIAVVHELELLLDVQRTDTFSREHFGFADALSQPLPYDVDGAVLVNGEPARQDPVQGVPLGEFVIGYMNGHNEKAPGPVVPGPVVMGPVVPGPVVPGGAGGASADAARAGLPPLAPASAGLTASAQAEGFFDFGCNGSYLVARELKQDVAAFWASMETNAVAIRARTPGQPAIVDAGWLAARVVGRDVNGHLLCPRNARLPALSNGEPDSGFTFYDTDPLGAGCPPGSHVRRAFPRDALAPTPDAKPVLLQAANNHRILRRGRKFGPEIADPMQDDGADRGLLFMCLNTDIERQFEFVQQTWLLNPAFATLSDEVDPLVGPCGPMTIRENPVRVTAQVDTFVKMAGGDYFFLPSLPALRYLAML